MTTLYQRTDCPFCWKVRLAFAELSVPYDVVETTLGEKHPQLQRLSPTGTVPVLVDSEVVIWESGVILEYLNAKCVASALVPASPAAGASVRTLHAYSDKFVGPALRDLVFEKRSKPAEQWNMQLITHSEQRWAQCQDYLEVQLAHKTFFGGQLYSAADCALAARCGVAEAYGTGIASSHPALRAWYGRVKSRDSWLQALPQSFISSTE